MRVVRAACPICIWAGLRSQRVSRYTSDMDNQERLEQFLELCRQIYEGMKRDGTWPWPADLKMSKRHDHASIEDDPVRLFDNSSSGSEPANELLTAIEAARFLRISVSGVRRLQHARHLPFIKVGNSVRFAKRDLMSYIEKRRVKTLDQNNL